MRTTAYYLTITKNSNSSTAQTALALWTPASGYRIVLQGLAITSLTAQTTTLLFDSTTVIPLQYTGANGNVMLSAGGAAIAIGAADAVLKYTTTASVATSLVVWGYEDQF